MATGKCKKCGEVAYSWTNYLCAGCQFDAMMAMVEEMSQAEREAWMAEQRSLQGRIDDAWERTKALRSKKNPGDDVPPG